MVKKVKWQVGDEKIEEVDHFFYLGSEITRDAFKLWCWRRMLKISWKKKLTNERVLQMVAKIAERKS